MEEKEREKESLFVIVSQGTSSKILDIWKAWGYAFGTESYAAAQAVLWVSVLSSWPGEEGESLGL